MSQKCVCGILGLKLLWHTPDRSAVLLRIVFDGEELWSKVSTRHVNLGILYLVVTSKWYIFSKFVLQRSFAQ